MYRTKLPKLTTIVMYLISLIISRTFLHETAQPKNGVRLTIEMRLTFGIFVKFRVRHAYAYVVNTKSHMQGYTDLVEGKSHMQGYTDLVEGKSHMQGYTDLVEGKSHMQGYTDLVEGKSHMQGYTDLVEGIFLKRNDWLSELGGATYNRVRLRIGKIRYSVHAPLVCYLTCMSKSFWMVENTQVMPLMISLLQVLDVTGTRTLHTLTHTSIVWHDSF